MRDFRSDCRKGHPRGIATRGPGLSKRLNGCTSRGKRRRAENIYKGSLSRGKGARQSLQRLGCAGKMALDRWPRGPPDCRGKRFARRRRGDLVSCQKCLEAPKGRFPSWRPRDRGVSRQIKTGVKGKRNVGKPQGRIPGSC